MFSTIGYWICVPFAWLVRLFYTLTGSYGVALILFTLVLKLILLPFQMKSKKSMVRMSRMSGKIEEIRKEAFADIDKCIVHILKNTLSYLDTTTDDTDPMSIDTYNYYVAHQAVADKLKEVDI